MATEPVIGIPLVAPSPSLLTSASPLPDVVWRSGIGWVSECGHPSNVWPYCPDPDDLKDEATSLATVGTMPFVQYTPFSCDWAVNDRDELERIARASTEVHAAWWLARALWMGDGLPATVPMREGTAIPPTLRNSATDVSFAAAEELDQVVAVLLSRYNACTQGAGGAVLHIPDILIPGAIGGLPGGGRVAWPEGSIYRGPLGAVVSPGPGYPHGASTQGDDGYGPAIDPDADPVVYQGNAITEVWVYVSGPVQYAFGDMEIIDSDGDVARRMNRTQLIAERPAIVRFDPCCVFAAKAVNYSGQVS